MKLETKKSNNFIILKFENKKYYLRGTELDYWPFAEVILANIYAPFELRKNDIVLDLGANIGLFTIMVADKVKKIVSIEPEISNFNVLKKNILENNLKNVIILNKALSDKKEKLKIEGTSALAKISCNGNIVEADSIDSILEEQKIQSVDIVKMDIEGYESKVLKNFLGLKKIREIIVEVHGENLRHEVFELLQQNRFKIKDISEFDYKAVIKQILLHPLDFLNAERKNEFRVTKLCIKFFLRLEQKPGHLSRDANISVFYGKNRNSNNLS